MSSSSENENVEVKKAGRPRQETSAWRRLPDGGYDSRPINHLEYFRNYMNSHYREKWGVAITCPLCNASITICKLKRHQQSLKCSRNRNSC